MKNVGLFTPRDPSGARVRMNLSPADMRLIGRGEWSATVTDQNTGRIYEVRGADCGLRCMCDAEIVREVC